MMIPVVKLMIRWENKLKIDSPVNIKHYLATPPLIEHIFIPMLATRLHKDGIITYFVIEKEKSNICLNNSNQRYKYYVIKHQAIVVVMHAASDQKQE